MTDEQKLEIIKALAYGIDEQTVAECNNIDISEVKILVSECGTAISEKRKEIKEAYPDAF